MVNHTTAYTKDKDKVDLPPLLARKQVRFDF